MIRTALYAILIASVISLSGCTAPRQSDCCRHGEKVPMAGTSGGATSTSSASVSAGYRPKLKRPQRR